jgi:hypothetical protein
MPKTNGASPVYYIHFKFFENSLKLDSVLDFNFVISALFAADTLHCLSGALLVTTTTSYPRFANF